MIDQRFMSKFVKIDYTEYTKNLKKKYDKISSNPSNPQNTDYFIYNDYKTPKQMMKRLFSYLVDLSTKNPLFKIASICTREVIETYLEDEVFEIDFVQETLNKQNEEEKKIFEKIVEIVMVLERYKKAKETMLDILTEIIFWKFLDQERDLSSRLFRREWKGWYNEKYFTKEFFYFLCFFKCVI